MGKIAMQSETKFRLGVLVVMALLAGCAKGTRDLEEKLAEIRSRQGAPVEPLPAMRDFPPFPYAAFDLRDPFAH